jgi:hypothetical protein
MSGSLFSHKNTIIIYSLKFNPLLLYNKSPPNAFYSSV